MKIAEELIGQQFIKDEIAAEHVRDQPLGYVLQNGRFKVEDVRFANRPPERVDHVRKQCGELVARKGSLPISGLQWHQRLRAWRSGSSFFTPLVRTCPAGTARFSSRVDVEAARAAIFATGAGFSGATFWTAFAFACPIAAPPSTQLPPAASSCFTDDGYTVALLAAHGPKYQIHLNGVKPFLRQRFTLVHEISHVWLGHLHNDDLAEDHQQEAEANFFASYLLAPDQLVLAWVPELTVAGIAEKFQVSREAAGLIHERVLRMLNTGAQHRDYDRRIASAGAQRVRSADASPVPEIEGSA